MKTIQVVLIGLSMLAATVGSIAFRSKLISRLLALLLFAVATGFVLFPEVTSDIAQLIGVGRGTDLIFYLVVFAGVHSCLLLYMRSRRMERKVTELVRALAVETAVQPKSHARSSRTTKGLL